jgi:homoserine kinase type II
MAVYTQLSIEDIQSLVDRLDIGRVTAATGVAAGVENSTYFLSTARPAAPSTSLSGSGKSSSGHGEYVLTVAETISIEDLKFIAALCTHLSERNLPIPVPQARPYF